jgi:lipopolysaccharide transport system ATP-binding protein
MSAAIILQKVTKRFRHYPADRPRTLVEAMVRGWQRLRPKANFLALDQVSLNIQAGKMIGIIGENGAGKSTLLRLVSRIIQPDAGRIIINGRVGALLELGVGFHPELTGRENIFINGVISGLTRIEVTRQFDAIVDFSELEPFIDSPLRTYSSGMWMRLAFSVAIHATPDILLVDEVLAVGDIRFQEKCLEKIRQYKTDGCTILFVTHNHAQVKELCDEAVWLNAGEVQAHGPPEIVVNQYVNKMKLETLRRTPSSLQNRTPASSHDLVLHKNRLGSLDIEISAVRLLDANHTPVTEIESGAPLWVEIAYHAPQPIQTPLFGVTITREDGLVCYDTSSESQHLLGVSENKGKVVLGIERLDLIGGHYFVDVGIYRQDWAYAYDYHWRVYPLTVRPTPGEKGVLRPPHQWHTHI